MVSEFFTWEMLLSFTGCVTATALLTQFVKNVSFLREVNNQVISYIFALVIMIFGGIVTGGFSISALGLDVVNAVAVALAANGVYDGAHTIMKKLENQDE